MRSEETIISIKYLGEMIRKDAHPYIFQAPTIRKVKKHIKEIMLKNSTEFIDSKIYKETCYKKIEEIS